MLSTQGWLQGSLPLAFQKQKPKVVIVVKGNEKKEEKKGKGLMTARGGNHKATETSQLVMRPPHPPLTRTGSSNEGGGPRFSPV